MKPTTIMPLQLPLTQFLNPVNINAAARNPGFTQRLRDIAPFQLVTALVSALSKGNCSSIADLHRQFNGMQLSEADFVAYRPFHNQLRKPEFALFMQRLTQQAIAQCLMENHADIPLKLRRFQRVILQDGTTFAVHDSLAEALPGRFKAISPAAVECHLSLSLFEQCPLKMTVTADTESERKYLPTPCELTGNLLLADAGYVDNQYFSEVDKHQGKFLVRGIKSLNPTVIEARNGKGHLLPRLSGRKLKTLTRSMNRSEVLDLKVKWTSFECRVIRRWVPEEKRFCLWMTNLEHEEFSADDVMSLYRCRWQIELFFKELKSDTTLRRFATRQETIVMGLIWASLLTAVLRRWTARCCPIKISLFKATKNVDVWFLPIIEAIAHRALQDIKHRFEWAMRYLEKNGLPTRQRKTRKNSSLAGIYERFNS